MKHVEYPQSTNLYQHDAHSVSTTPRISLGFPWQSFELHRCCRIPTRHSDCHWSYLQPAFKALRVGEPSQTKKRWFQRYSGFDKSILKHCEESNFASNYVDHMIHPETSDIFVKLMVHADPLKKVNFGCMYPFTHPQVGPNSRSKAIMIPVCTSKRAHKTFRHINVHNTRVWQKVPIYLEFEMDVLLFLLHIVSRWLRRAK